MAQDNTASAAAAQKTVNVPAPAGAPAIKASEAPKAAPGTATAPRAEVVALKRAAVAPREPEAAPRAEIVGTKAPAPAARKPKAAARVGAATGKKAAPASRKPKAALRVGAATAKTTAPARREAKAIGAVGEGFGDLLAAGQDNLEACMTCGRIVATGLETLGKEVMTLTQANIEANLAATKGIMTAKTLREVIDVQSGYAQVGIERMADESAKMGALSMRVASQAMEPLQNRLDANARMAFRPFGL